MKIAVSGSSSTGKTTLAKALAGRFSAAFIAEGFEALFNPPGTRQAPRPEVLVELFNEVLERKRAAEEAEASFVADRCPLDLLNLWLHRGLQRNQAASDAFCRRCREYTAAYDYVVFPAWATVPLLPVENPGAHRRRVLNPWVQLENHAAILGLAHLFLPAERIIVLPAGLADAAQRLDFILRRLDVTAL